MTFFYLLLLMLYVHPAKAVINQPIVDDSPELTLHKQLVELALNKDFYAKRCRGTSLSKSFGLVNRLFIRKYSLTANNFIKTYLADGTSSGIKTIKSQHKKTFNHKLAQIGGCRAAKKQGWLLNDKSHFENLYKKVERSNWYPE